MRVPDEAYRAIVRPLYRLHNHISILLVLSIKNVQSPCSNSTPLVIRIQSHIDRSYPGVHVRNIRFGLSSTSTSKTTSLTQDTAKDHYHHHPTGPQEPPASCQSMFVLMYKTFFVCVFCGVHLGSRIEFLSDSEQYICTVIVYMLFIFFILFELGWNIPQYFYRTYSHSINGIV